MKIKQIIIVLAFVIFLLVVRTVNAQDVATVLFVPSGNTAVGQTGKIDVYINSNVNVNAVQLAITYPQNEFQIINVDSSHSDFSIKAEETQTPGVVKVARGNIKAIKGKKLVTSLTVKALLPSSNTSHFSYSTADSLVMSEDNFNVLSRSLVLTVKSYVPTPTSALSAVTQYGKDHSKGFITILTEAVSEFFHGLFRN